MKQLKPFKVGATYKLRREMADEITINKTMIKFGYNADRLINEGFKVNAVIEGGAFHVRDDIIFVLIASVHERHMFYRVDNKKPQ